MKAHFPAMLQALAAALLFGVSAPLAKLFLGEIEPIPLAAFLYLGSGVVLFGIKAFQQLWKITSVRKSTSGQKIAEQEAPITKPDWGWLAGAILAGGVAAPIVLLFSLQATPAATASLLLNFEGVATMLIAALAFKEAINRRAWWAITLITLSSIFLSVQFNAEWGFSLGALGILLACILWGIDNNFTHNISAKDPLAIVTIKGLTAGSFSLALALILGNPFPALGIILGAMLLGCLSYGVSIVLFIHAMRGLGAARTSALFSTAPIAGVLFSFVLFQEMPNLLFILAFPMMLIGTLLLVSEQHGHHHIHELLVHEHAHVHDEDHHKHEHDGEKPRRHSHLHKHAEISHEHPHMPDLHHRHRNPKES
jgi:drug/metabolite transporter (DMT)-like permease